MLIKPIVIVLNVIICTLIACTAILWIPIIILLYYVINLTIYQFDLDERGAYGRYSERFFPLISASLKLVYDIVYTLTALLMIVFHPIAAGIVVIFAVFRLVLRTLYDKFMYCTVSCCGRSPVRDTGIAWKISGPGLSRQYFQSIREGDVYVLVIA